MASSSCQIANPTKEENDYELPEIILLPPVNISDTGNDSYPDMRYILGDIFFPQYNYTDSYYDDNNSGWMYGDEFFPWGNVGTGFNLHPSGSLRMSGEAEEPDYNYAVNDRPLFTTNVDSDAIHASGNSVKRTPKMSVSMPTGSKPVDEPIRPMYGGSPSSNAMRVSAIAGKPAVVKKKRIVTTTVATTTAVAEKNRLRRKRPVSTTTTTTTTVSSTQRSKLRRKITTTTVEPFRKRRTTTSFYAN
ncbi:hypothetical protein RP20_CCG001182 [Aedes albopictus]|nr:hypothetical protein RP20_CCG001028 [Aedes albopictus]KXJ79412.1 hypothetical protein RP20_CCG001182 [Aedes albopictus]